MKTLQKTITINGTRYTADRLRKLAATGDRMNGMDTCIELPYFGEIAIREYKGEATIAVLNYGMIREDGQPFGGAVAFLA